MKTGRSRDAQTKDKKLFGKGWEETEKEARKLTLGYRMCREVSSQDVGFRRK